MELIVEGVEVAQRPQIGILLDGESPLVVQVIGNSCRRNKFEATETAGVVGIDDWVKDDVDGMKMEPHDRPDFGTDAPRFPIVIVNTELEIHAIKELVVL